MTPAMIDLKAFQIVEGPVSILSHSTDHSQRLMVTGGHKKFLKA